MFTGKIDSIQVLRVIASAGIALYHIECFFKTGLLFNYGVHIFFIISGFLAMYTTQKGLPKNFIGKRLIRILPLYYLLTIFTFAVIKLAPGLIDGEGSISELLRSLTFIPYSRVGNDASLSIRPLVGPAWTLYYDFGFTVLFSLAMHCNHKKRGYIVSKILAILLICGLVLDTDNVFVICYTGVYWIDFIVGILVFYLLKKVYHKVNVNMQKRIGLLLISVAFIVLMISGVVEKVRWLVYPILSAAVVVLFVIALKDCHIPKMIIQVGDASFSFYLLHYYVIFLIGLFCDFSAINIKSICGAVVVYIVSLFLSQISYKIIEVRFSGVLKRKLGW